MYLKLNNGVIEKYPYTIGDLRKDNPNTSFPKDIPPGTLQEFNVFPVVATERPQVSYTQDVTEVDPVFYDGVWTQTWSVTEADEATINLRIEQEAEAVRSSRNERLSACDWTQGKDIDDAVSSAWATYRQELRDIPEQPGFPFAVNWPVPPT